MKLQSQISRRYGNKEYRKSWIVVSQEFLEKLGWKSGDDLELKIDKNKLIIDKK